MLLLRSSIASFVVISACLPSFCCYCAQKMMSFLGSLLFRGSGFGDGGGVFFLTTTIGLASTGFGDGGLTIGGVFFLTTGFGLGGSGVLALFHQF